MIRIELSYFDEASGGDAWLDITQSVAKQFSAGLPPDFQRDNYGVYPDKTASAQESGLWYDLRQCVLDAVNDAKEQLEIAKQNPSSSSTGVSNVELAEKKVESLKHFFDGRVHAIRVTDTEHLGVSSSGINIRVLMEYRYTSRNA